ncbi:MAG TPA: fumarylacetoacetate hydrolase family protein [Dehalococcoidia bacterium]|nr:fumarylacetoacetate hydrolase family protein [Dehalococcoidia bacterium]
MAQLDLTEVCDDFWRERQAGVYYPPRWFGQLSIDEAYRVQLDLLRRYLEQGAHHIGWKVGLTGAAIQRQFGVHEPVFGFILEEDRHPSGARIEFDRLIEPGIENEICARLGSDLRGPGVDERAARRAAAVVQPALELIETRGPFSQQLAVAIAENVQQKGVVLGEPRPVTDDPDLNRVGVVVSIRGETVATVSADESPADPLASVVWLANKLAQYGLGLKAGEIVMTGSLTRQFAVRRGDRVVADFDPLGLVEVTFV